jgi:tRNA nucleotidyltransferase (CCA-adding enzyme)
MGKTADHSDLQTRPETGSGENRVNPTGSRPQTWELFSHMADIGIRGTGPTLEDAFEETALAMCAVITDPALVRPDLPVEVHCSAPDSGLLLVDWLNSLIAAMSERRMIFSHFKVIITDDKLHGKAWGEIVSPQRHRPAVEIKGATLTELRISRDADGLWMAQCVVDV